MKKFYVALVLSLILCFASISMAEPVTVNNRTFSVVYENKEYFVYFDRTNDLLSIDETGVCYISAPNKVVAIFDYWYKEGEVVRLYGFSDFLLSPNKLIQITYGPELIEVYAPRH